MASCTITKTLVTSNSDKIDCVNVLTCDSIKADVSIAGLSSYQLQLTGGPNNVKDTGTRSIRSCDILSITSSVVITKIQSKAVSNSEKRFIVPYYSETDSNCPVVSQIKIYEKDCSTISTAFSNSNDLMSSLSDGLLYGELANDKVPQT